MKKANKQRDPFTRRYFTQNRSREWFAPRIVSFVQARLDELNQTSGRPSFVQARQVRIDGQRRTIGGRNALNVEGARERGENEESE